MLLFFINLAVILGLALGLREPANGQIRRPGYNQYLVLAMGYLTLLALLRSYEVGTDTSNYRYLYSILGQDVWHYLTDSDWEKGFVLLCHVLFKLFHNPRSLIVVAGAFTFFSVYRFFDRHSKMPWMSVFLFFTLLVFDFFLSGMRQAIAISILLFAYDKLLERKPVPFVLLVLLAMQFHTTAIIFLLAYPVTMIRDEKKYFLISGLGAVLVAVSWKILIPALLTVFPRYSYFLGDEAFSSGGALGMVLKGGVYLAVLAAGELLGNRERLGEKTLEEQILCRLVWFLPLFCVMGTSAAILSRFLRYFELFVCIYLPAVLVQRKTEQYKRLMIPLCVAAFSIYALVIQVTRTPDWQTSYPYQFFWQ